MKSKKLGGAKMARTSSISRPSKSRLRIEAKWRAGTALPRAADALHTDLVDD